MSGVAATRVSPGFISLGTAISIIYPPAEI